MKTDDSGNFLKNRSSATLHSIFFVFFQYRHLQKKTLRLAMKKFIEIPIFLLSRHIVSFTTRISGNQAEINSR